MGRKMMFEQFTIEVVNRIKEFLPDSFADATVELNSVTKNNDLVLTGLIVRSTASNMSPTIYLDQFYEQYRSGEEMNNILADIADLRLRHELKDCFNVEQITDFSEVRDRIVPRICDAEWNSSLLETRPHTVIADLAVTYHILLTLGEYGSASVPVTYQLMESWGLDTMFLHELALQNMATLIPSTLQSMSTVLSSLITDEEDLISCVPSFDDYMFILSNEQKVNGSSAILDREFMLSIIDQFGQDFYLIPSSVHEWILINSDNMDPMMLSSMVCEVNAGVVSPEDRLSSHAYRYTASEGLIPA